MLPITRIENPREREGCGETEFSFRDVEFKYLRAQVGIMHLELREV